MNKNFPIVIAIVFLIVGGIVGYVIKPASSPATPNINLGAIAIPSNSTTTYGTALQESLLYQWQYNVVNSLANVRASLAGVSQGTTASLNFPSLATSSLGIATTTTVTDLAAAAGDIVLVQPSTVIPNVEFSASVSVASTTTATIEIFAQGISSTVVDPAATTFYITVVPHASFVAPSSLKVATTATPYSN